MNKKYITILLLLGVCMLYNITGAQSVFSNKSPNEHTKPDWKVLYKIDVLTNEASEFYRANSGRLGRCEVSPDGEKIAIPVSYPPGIKSSSDYTTLEVISKDAELIFSSDELVDFHVLDFAFDPTSQYIALVFGITNPHKEAETSKIPVGFGILDFANKEITWVTGGPQQLRGPVLKSCSWPQGGFIYAYGITNDKNDYLRNAFLVDPVTYAPLNGFRQNGDHEPRMFTINAATKSINETNLPLEQLDTFSPDGQYYFGSPYYSTAFNVYNSETGEDISDVLYKALGDTLYYFGLSLKSRWIGTSGAILALDVSPSKRYDRTAFTGPTHWIIDLNNQSVLYKSEDDDFSFDLGFYAKTNPADYIIKKQGRYERMSADLESKIKAAVNK